jgi:ClpP class serine protease
MPSLEAQLNHALANPSVRGIIWEIDSPGGTVSGAFTLADQIFNARGMKAHLGACQ